MDINFSKSADSILLEVLGTYIDPQGMVWSDGVSQQQYEDWCSKNNSPSQGDIRGVSWTPTKKEIVSQLYWIPNARLLPPGADYLFLDVAWLMGVTNAIMVLQRTVAAPVTGVIDAPTQIALGKLRLPLDSQFVNAFCDEYEAHFAEVIKAGSPDAARLQRYWTNRVSHARENAIAIIRAGMQ